MSREKRKRREREDALEALSKLMDVDLGGDIKPNPEHKCARCLDRKEILYNGEWIECPKCAVEPIDEVNMKYRLLQEAIDFILDAPDVEDAQDYTLGAIELAKKLRAAGFKRSTWA